MQISVWYFSESLRRGIHQELTQHLEAPEDLETKAWVKKFQKFDFYSKGDASQTARR